MISNMGPVYLGITLLFVLTVILILLWRVIVPMWVRRRQSDIQYGQAWVEDRAWNQIQAGNALADFLDREGVDVREARSTLEQALGKYEMKRFGEAQRMAKQASDSLAEKRRKSKASEGHTSSGPVAKMIETPEPEPPVYRDLAHRVGDPEPDPPTPVPTSSTSAPTTRRAAALPMEAPHPPTDPSGAQRRTEDDEGERSPALDTSADAEEGTLHAERAKRPKDYMEARFMLASLQEDLRGAPPERQASPEFREARDWAQKSQGAFDRKDYTESLRLAMRGRRRLGGTGISTISVGAGTVVEAPPEEISPTAQRSSAPPHSALSTTPGTAPRLSPSSPASNSPPSASPMVSCGRCGRVNSPGDRFCRGCGAPLAQPKCPRCQKPVEPTDKFCHGCGAPLGG